ncbi:MAG: beta-lactamase family protein [Gemmatimonadales bacterium]|nr:beta-lactamase family protein [Gemmatimonadales bacterium]
MPFAHCYRSLPHAVVGLILLAAGVSGQQLTPAERAGIDSAARSVLAGTGAPSTSIAVVRGGEIVYTQAYGDARTGVPATPAMRYAIGSVSKQFTAAAVLLLAEDGKLSLDDPVSRWFPALTRASDVNLRHLLSMTSGYQDYWPQDYVFTAMQSPTTPDAIAGRWARPALDFEPGAAWQYSNTNYVIAGAIVERVAGMPFMEFLRLRVFTPLGMNVADFDAGPLESRDAGAWLRNGLGPLRPAPKEGQGWLFAAGQLAMSAHDLATWNIAMMNRAAMSPASYREQQTATRLSAGTATGYGLGINVGMEDGRRRLAHGGAVSGYTTTNIVYPDDRTAITVFTNIYPGGGGASGQIAARIAAIILPQVDSHEMAVDALARRLYDGLMHGKVDRDILTPNARDYFDARVLADYGASLGGLGAPTEFTATGSSVRGGLRIRNYRIRAGEAILDLTMMTTPEGQVEQYVVQRSG